MDWICRKEIFQFAPKQCDLRPSSKLKAGVGDIFASQPCSDVEILSLREELKRTREHLKEREGMLSRSHAGLGTEYLKYLKSEYNKLCSSPQRSPSVSACKRDSAKVRKSQPVVNGSIHNAALIAQLDEEEAALLLSISELNP